MAKTETLEPTEKEETKTSKGSSDKKKKKKDKPKAAKSLPGMEKQLEVKLPQGVQDQKVKVRSVIPTRDFNVGAKEIAGVSKQIYVGDIHSVNPTVLATIYWLRLIDNPHVIVRCAEEEYRWCLDNLKLDESSCLVSVIDCATFPTITYGWRRSHLKNEFPTLDQIKKYEDDHFKDNPTYVHNWPINPKIREMEAEKKIDDEDFIIDDEEDIEVAGAEVVSDEQAASSEDSGDDEEYDWDDE